MVKVISKGLIGNGKNSYLRDVFQIIDFIIVIVSLGAIIDSNNALNIVKILRTVRLLRPLRLISQNENLKLSLQALVVAIPSVSSLLMITLLIMFIFGIIACNLLKGMSYYCETDHLVLS